MTRAVCHPGCVGHGRGRRHRVAVRGHDGLALVDQLKHRRAIRACEPCGRRRDRLQHRRAVRRRGGDDPQHFGGGRLLLQRLGDLTVALLKLGIAPLQLGEQAGVLDGDDRLIRERLQEGDLMVGERAYLLPPQPQHADRLTMLEERDRHRRSETPPLPASTHVGPRKLGLSGFGKIDHGDRLSIEKGATAHGLTIQLGRSLGVEEVRAIRFGHAVDGGAAKRADRQTTVVRSWTLNAHGVGIAGRAAASQIAVSTMSRSVGDAAMTRSTSAVACSLLGGREHLAELLCSPELPQLGPQLLDRRGVVAHHVPPKAPTHHDGVGVRLRAGEDETAPSHDRPCKSRRARRGPGEDTDRRGRGAVTGVTGR